MKVLNDSDFQTVGPDTFREPNYMRKGFCFSLEDVNTSITRINAGLGWDIIHTNHLKYSGSVFRNFNKMLSHTFIPHEMLKGEISPILRSGKGCKSDSTNYRPIMRSSNLLKMLENLLIPSFERNLKINPRQFGFRPNTNCQAAI